MRTITLIPALFRLNLLRLAVAVPTLALFQTLAIAQTQEEDLFSDLPIVISASRLNQSVLNSPSSASVIDKAMIEASGFIEFVDLLRLVPGFQVAHVDGRRYTAVYHGYGSDIANKIQVLVNGRSTYTPTLSTVDWDMLGIRLEDVDRIEVVRGSSASAYGSNSFTSAINIITKSPQLDDSLNIHTRIGNKGERDQLFRFSGSVDNLSYRVTASKRKNDGFDDYHDSRNFEHLSFHGQINHQSNRPMDIYFSYTDGVTGVEEKRPVTEERDRDVTSWSTHIKGSNIFSPTEEVKWSLYHNNDDSYDQAETLFPYSGFLGITPAEFEITYGVPDETFMLGFETNSATKTDAEIEYSSSNLQGIKYVVGAGIRYDTLLSPSYFNEKGRVSDTTLRFFGNGQVSLTDNITFNGGAILEHVNSFDTKISPRASINWQFPKSQSVRLAISRGYRFPSLLEKNFETNTILSNGFVIDQRFFSDGNLRPEKIDSIELGYLGKLSQLPLSWDIKLYKEKITDIIAFAQDLSVNDPLPGNAQFVRKTLNGDYSTTYGLEGELTYRTSNHSFIKFLFNRGHTNSLDIRTINPIETQHFETGVPRESYGLLAAKDINDWQFSLGVYHVGEVEWFNNGDLVDQYTRGTALISKTFKINRDNELKVKIATQRIGEEYKEYNKLLSFEPRYYITVSLRSL